MILRNMITGIACGFLLVTGAAIADGHAAAEKKIRHAMSAAPTMIAGEATILDVDGSVLREGSNGWTCYPGVPLTPGSVDPMCNDAVWQSFIAKTLKGEAFTTDVIGFSYMLAGDGFVNNDDPAGTDKTKGTWIKEGPHLMVLLPESAVGDTPTTPAMPGPYVMWAGTPVFHLMVPLADRPEGTMVVHEH